MAWIESHQELARHPKTKKLSRLLGVSLPAAVGHLHFFWWWAMDYAQDGDISRYDMDEVADACGWEGEPKILHHALFGSGFIEGGEGEYHIHDWHDYAGRLIEKREQNRERKKKSRARHAPVTQESQGNPDDGHDGHGATEPNPTIPNHTVPIKDNRGDKSPGRNTFKPPTLEEVKSFCEERNNGVDSSKWFDFYASKGWMIGKNKMKDWKAAIRTWERGNSDAKSRASPERGRGEYDHLSL